jgi:NADH-quinone oxidoreductase subunit H
VAAAAELNHPPFDIMEAESELVAGFHTEYSGMKFGLLQLAEFAGAVASAAIISTLFFRGWANPFVPLGGPQLLPSHLWFLLKVFFVLFLFIWVRATLPRLRVDQIMGFAWKVLFPLAILNLFLTGVEVLLWPEPTAPQLWVLTGVNLAVAAACVVGFSRFLETGRRLPASSVRLVRFPMEVR